MGPQKGVWEMGEERATCDGSSKKVDLKSGGKGANYPAMLKICNRKMANDGSSILGMKISLAMD